MNLRTYLASKNMTNKDLSVILDINPCYMSRIVNGYQPSKKLARNIEKATGGQVTFGSEVKKEEPNNIDQDKKEKKRVRVIRGLFLRRIPS